MPEVFSDMLRNGSSLSTEAGARRRLKPFLPIIEEQNINYAIITADGRYAPIVMLRPGQHHLMHSFLNAKIGVFG